MATWEDYAPLDSTRKVRDVPTWMVLEAALTWQSIPTSKKDKVVAMARAIQDVLAPRDQHQDDEEVLYEMGRGLLAIATANAYSRPGWFSDQRVSCAQLVRLPGIPRTIEWPVEGNLSVTRMPSLGDELRFTIAARLEDTIVTVEIKSEGTGEVSAIGAAVVKKFS